MKVLLKFALILFLFLVVIFHFKIEDIFLHSSGKCCWATVSDEIMHSRSATDTYYYKFTIERKVYKGDSWISIKTKNRPDSVCIVYLPIFPRINRSIPGYFKGDFNGCNCE